MYSPVPAFFGVDAHPMNTVIRLMQIRKLNKRCLFTMTLSPLVQDLGGGGESAPLP
jgi:hypothetical protein